MIRTLAKEHGITITKRATHEGLLYDHDPYAQVLAMVVKKAHSSRASDLHIEPNQNGVQIRIRVNGNLSCIYELNLSHRESLILEAKRIFGLNIAQSGKPQDSRISLPSLKLDLRVSLLPTHFGEKIVLRLLDLNSSFELKNLGLNTEAVSALKKSLENENGVIIISGPTGSGKTKTLYSLLNEANPILNNIITLEDPIEFRLPGLNQVQVGSKLSFADALRSVLRQDPDIILVGEIRDPETARLCFQAAETGHLVFSTLHANGAVEVYERLKGLGVEEDVLNSNLRLSCAQRLEQTLCPYCKIKLHLGYIPNQAGCPHCKHGIQGRLPILEWAIVIEKKISLIKSLDESRIELIQQGIISKNSEGHL